MTPEGLDLLDEAARLLREELAPTLTGEARYHTLLAANAVAMAGREAGMKAEPDDAALVAAIRAGAHDGDGALHARLLASAARRAWVADPGALTEAERAAYLRDR